MHTISTTPPPNPNPRPTTPGTTPAIAASPSTMALRFLAAAAILVGGLVHLQLYFRGGYRLFPDANLGRSFLLNGIASVAVAAALMVRRDVLVRLAGLGVTVGTLVAFYLTRETAKGIFGFTEKGFAPSPQAAIALVVEIVALVILLASFLPALTWKGPQLFANSIVIAGLGVLAFAAVGIVGGVLWARTPNKSSSNGPYTTAAPTDTAAGGTTGGAAPADTTPGASTPAASTAPAAGGPAVIIKGFAFSPAKLAIKVGDTVTWTNEEGGTPHNVDSKDNTFDSPPTLENGATFTHKFDKAGTFTYICSLHPFMSGEVDVTG